MTTEPFMATNQKIHNNYFMLLWRSISLTLLSSLVIGDPNIKLAQKNTLGTISRRRERIYSGFSYAATDSIEYAGENPRHSINRATESGCSWKSISDDVDFLLDSPSVTLVNLPLWFNEEEPKALRKQWSNFKEYFLRSPHLQWSVWTDWWEDRRDGKPYNIEMEREIVLIPDEDWQQGPAHVNAMIAEIRARYADKDIPTDNPVAPRFETDGGRIVPRIDLPEELPSDEQAELYDALRAMAVELHGLCPENSNRYIRQGKAVAAFLSALGDDYGSMRLTMLWLAAEKLRSLERADDDKRAAKDPEDEPMEPDQGALLAEVVTVYNVFSTGESKLKAKDDKGRDPATLSRDTMPEARALRVAVSKAPNLFADTVGVVLDGVIETADDPHPGVSDRGVTMSVETFENLMGAVARQSRAEPEKSETLKGAKEAAGAQAVTGATKVGTTIATAFIANYEEPLVDFASKLPASAVWVSIIRKIAKNWSEP